jgi:hypothetical protein
MDPSRKATADEPPAQVPPAPRGSPGTDPTNPCRQETAGINAAAEETNERKVSEVGLTDEDRARRAPNQ